MRITDMRPCVAEGCDDPRLEGRSVCGECACDFLAGRFDVGWADDDDRFNMSTEGAAYASVFTGARGSEVEFARFYRLPFEPDLVNANDRALHFIARMNAEIEARFEPVCVEDGCTGERCPHPAAVCCFPDECSDC